MNTAWKMLPLIALIALTTSCSASGASSSDPIGETFTLGIFGNADMDEDIDEKDIAYVDGVIKGTNAATNLSDANYDGKIDTNDIEQIEQIIRGEEKKLVFMDVIGEVETVNKPVKRLVVVMSDAPEVLRALNAVDKIVGATVDAKRDGEVFFPELSNVKSVGKWTSIDHEAVLSTQPDVYMPYTPHATSPSVWPSTKKDKGELKNKLPGVSIVALDFVTMKTFSENVLKLGYILDKENEAKEFADWYDGYLTEIKEQTMKIPEDKKPLVFTMTYGKYKTGIPGSRYHELMTISGGRNIASDLPIPAGGSTTGVTVDPEWVMEQNPDIIIRKDFLETNPCYSTDNPRDLVATLDDIFNTTELSNVTAVKNKRVYAIANLLQTGPHSLMYSPTQF